jgi:hypothetical protein
MAYVKKNIPSGPEALDGQYYIDKFKNIYGDRYSYNLDDFKKREVGIRNRDLKISIKCIHGTKEISVRRHLEGYECRSCKGTSKDKTIKYEKIKKERKKRINNKYLKATKEEFIEKALLVHGNKYNYDQFIYNNCKVKGSIICPIHGLFKQTADNHINAKQGCPRCGSDGIYNEWYFNNYPEKKDAEAMLYLAKFSLDKEEFIKIGITTKDLNKRLFSPSKNAGYIVSSILQYKTKLFNAWQIEQKVINDFKEYKYEPKIYFPRTQ